MKYLTVILVLVLAVVNARWNPFEDWNDVSPDSWGKGSSNTNNNDPSTVYIDESSPPQEQPDWAGGFGQQLGQLGSIGGLLNGGGDNQNQGSNPLGALQGLMGGGQEDSNFLSMAQQLYSLYQTNPKLIGNALQGFISNWSQ
mmetsp:Transcript_3631/g.4239  ORF Transcript_3631/g.4239 Transcript_3631/m.4239 type:complete len:142 (+) Transcript_3631:12-437(+)